MNAALITITISELAGLVAIIHLWLRRRMRWLTKCCWTVFLLVPIFGPLFYAFLTHNPESHGENPTGGMFPG
jgi:hypothetical protein